MNEYHGVDLYHILVDKSNLNALIFAELDSIQLDNLCMVTLKTACDFPIIYFL